jgi:hypothetical protein
MLAKTMKGIKKGIKQKEGLIPALSTRRTLAERSLNHNNALVERANISQAWWFQDTPALA